MSSHTPEAVLLLTKADLVSGEEIARHKVRALVAGCRGSLILAERAAGAADAARADLVAALERERRGFGSVKGEIRLLCNHLQAEVRTAADERFHAYHGEATRRVTANLREAMAGRKGHLGRMTREFEEWHADVMMEEMGAVSLHGEGHLAGFLFRAQASVERSVRAFVDRLGREIENALGIRFEGARFDPQVEEPAHPDVRLSPTFDTYFELLWFLIPMPVFRPLVRRHSCAGSRGRSRRTSPAWRASGPTRGTGARRSGPRSRSLPTSNLRYPDRWKIK